MRTGRALLFFLFLSCTCFAQAENEVILSDMHDQLERLSKVNFHPNLLPIILKNSDYIELTPEQVAVFKAWGKANSASSEPSNGTRMCLYGLSCFLMAKSFLIFVANQMYE